MEKPDFAKDLNYKFEPDNLWFTSDTHFGHSNVISFCNRPFRDVAEMNETIIRRWNETVPEEGIIFHLGDFCHGGSSEWNNLTHRLNGRKFLILGNHDMKYYRQGFLGMFEYVSQQMTIRVGGQTIILNHNPFLAYGGSYRDVWQLFGHVHSGPNSNTGLDYPRLQYLFPRQYDVGVDNNDFRPVSFCEIKAKIEDQVRRYKENAGVPDFGTASIRRIIFVDSAVKPANKDQKKALSRIEDETGGKVIWLDSDKGETVKEAIARRITAIGGSTRYVYIGLQPLQDFRRVDVDKHEGITDAVATKAISFLK